MAGRSAIDLTFQMESLDLVRKKLADMEKKAPSVQANALNQTQTVLKKYLPQETLKEYTYKRKLQKPRQQRASRKKLTATLFYDRKDPGIQHFDFTPGSPGSQLEARIRSDGSLKSISRAFYNTSAPKLYGGIFRRVGKTRLPITKVFGPSEHNMVNHVWEKPNTQKYTTKTMSAKLDEQINNQYLKKWGLK